MADLPVQSFLQKNKFDRPIVFIYGNDDAYIDAVSRSILKNFTDWRDEPVEHDRHPGGIFNQDAAVVLDFFGNRPLFGGARSLTVSGITERHRPLLEQFLAAAPPPAQTNDLVLFSSSSLRSKSKVLDLFRVHDSVRVCRAYQDTLSRDDVRTRLQSALGSAPEDHIVNTVAVAASDLPLGLFDDLLEKLSLLQSDRVPLTEDDILACLPENVAGADVDLLSDLFDRDGDILNHLHNHLIAGGDSARFAASLGRQLGDARSISLGERRSIHWKTEKSITAMARRAPDLPSRLETAVIELHQYERRSRAAPHLAAIELERTLLRLKRAFSR